MSAPERVPTSRTFAAMAATVLAALAGLYAGGVWVPWSPWTVTLDEVRWSENYGASGTTQGWSVPGGSQRVVSYDWSENQIGCPVPSCGYRSVVIVSVTTNTSGFAVTASDLPANVTDARSPFLVLVTVATPWADYRGPLDLQLHVTHG